jgi:hypothetical protein
VRSMPGGHTRTILKLIRDSARSAQASARSAQGECKECTERVQGVCLHLE